MIEYIHEPTDLQCGQAVLAMVLGKIDNLHRIEDMLSTYSELYL